MVSELEPCGSHFTQHFMKAVQSKKKIDKNTGDVLKEIYLDNSATTVTCEKAAQKALEIMTTQYGNPSSLHSKGLEAQHELEYVRQVAAKYIGAADNSEIYFTSGGTEGNNTAVFGAVNALKRRGNKIVTTAIEHSSVLEAMQKLEKDGLEVVYLRPDSSGSISWQSLTNAIDAKTILVSVMAVNNETGAIQPIEKIRKIIDKAKAPAVFHVDAVQMFGKLPIKVKKTGVDVLTASSHKIHGPKGAGILYVRKGVRLLPLHYGGEQEHKLRPGTEPLPAVAGMGAAIEELPDFREELTKITELNVYLRTQLGKIENECF